jgi:acyl CoA:acetate/3-ketoacid CoA transferase beta subunit
LQHLLKSVLIHKSDTILKILTCLSGGVILWSQSFFRCKGCWTGRGVVNKIIMEKALIEVMPVGLELKEVFEGFSVQNVIDSTDANLIVKDVKEIVQIK